VKPSSLAQNRAGPSVTFCDAKDGLPGSANRCAHAHALLSRWFILAEVLEPWILAMCDELSGDMSGSPNGESVAPHACTAAAQFEVEQLFHFLVLHAKARAEAWKKSKCLNRTQSAEAAAPHRLWHAHVHLQ